jgi:hypothetical protein
MKSHPPGYDCDLATQIESLSNCLSQNDIVSEILNQAPSLAMPNWYLGAGCIAQTVWNLVHGFKPTAGIKDYDLVYHDASDISFEEAHYVEKAVDYSQTCARRWKSKMRRGSTCGTSSISDTKLDPTCP